MNQILRLTLCFFFFSTFVSLAQAADDIETTGSVLRVLLPVTAYSMTFVLDDQEGRHQFYKSFLSTVAVTYGLKAVIDKERPNGNGSSAFPSGHSAMAFSGASFIHRRYGLKYGSWAYIGATFVGWSRIHADKHDFTDVCAGALIGIGGTWLFTAPLKKNISVMPLISNDKIGMAFTAPW